MATKNIEVQKGNWQDLITIGDLSLTLGQYYALAIRGNGENEVILSDTEPTNLVGHTVGEDDNFGFVYEGEKIWVKLSPASDEKAIVVFS